MTTAVGTQFRPYVEEDTSTKEQEAVPCDFHHVASGTDVPMGQHPDDGPCPSEATHVGVCAQGDFSINACEECANHVMSGGLRKNPNGPLHLYAKQPCKHIAWDSGTKTLVWFPR